MEHDRYGLDGVPLACRSAHSDPVTGLPLPKVPDGSEGVPFLAPAIGLCMVAFALFFVVEGKLFG
jgi:hypothetical protein